MREEIACSDPTDINASGSQRRMSGASRAALIIATISTAAALVVGCGGSDEVSQVPQVPLDPQLVAAGQQTFRHDTFGDETFWTDVLQMHKVIEAAVDPLTAASVGLKVDADALPANVVQGIVDGSIALDVPQTTLALLSLNAVVGVKGEVSQGADGKLVLKRFGVTCALCHSTVSKDVHVLAGGKTDLAGIVGHRLDGWPNRDLQPGTIISLSPALTKKQAAEYASWAKLFGPGFYDPRINVNIDPGSNPSVGPDIDANLAAYKAAGGIPVVIPPAFGLLGLDKAIFTGDGDTAHEPAGPVSYWNRYVGVVQMHGHGTFFDERIIVNGKPLSVDHRVGDDLITPILPQVEAYQWSIPAPSLAKDGAQWGVAYSYCVIKSRLLAGSDPVALGLIRGAGSRPISHASRVRVCGVLRHQSAARSGPPSLA